MSAIEPLDTEVEEGSPVGEAICEESPEHILQTSLENDDPEPTDLFPFTNVSVELHEDSNDVDPSSAEVSGDNISEATIQEVIDGSETFQEMTIDGKNLEKLADDGKSLQEMAVGNENMEEMAVTSENVQETAVANENVQEMAVACKNVNKVVINKNMQAVAVGNSSVQELKVSDEIVQGMLNGSASRQKMAGNNENVQEMTDDSTVDSDASRTIVDESTNQSVDEQVSNVDTSEIYDPNLSIKEEPNIADYKELQKTYIENFIYSSGAGNFEDTSDVPFEDIKGYPLSRFPRIVKAVESSDYETLQVLYQLLYQRSAWDTQEILRQRILEFCGFNLSKKSEDYFNREMMLRTLPLNMLLKIGTLLSLDEVKGVLLDAGKSRQELVTGIMEFLSKPKRKSRIPTREDEPQKDGISNAVSVTNPCGCRSFCLTRLSEEEKKKLLEYLDLLEKKKLINAYLTGLMEIKKVVKNHSSKSYRSEEGRRLKEHLYQYKVKIGSKEIKVCKGGFCILHGVKMAKVNALQNNLKSGRNVLAGKVFPPFPGEEDTAKSVKDYSRSNSKPKKASNEEKSQKLEDIIKKVSNKVPKVVIEKIDLNSLSANSSPVKKQEETSSRHPKNEKKSDEVKPASNGSILRMLMSNADKQKTQVPGAEKVKLKDFPLVVKSIENAPEELLIDVHFLLFLKSANVEKMKNNILEFSGFPFEADTEEYDERNEFLQRMSVKILSDVARCFSLAILSTKEETVKNMLSFLSKPDESYLRTYGSVPVILSDVELDDIGDMSDSDESITCEVVEKKVECIDLLSSGEESDKEDKKGKEKSVSEKKHVPKNEIFTNVASQNSASATTAVSQAQSVTISQSGQNRTLRNFETICKIVNTHPHEYLVDIYDLLYMRKHEPSTLRNDILDFSGFAFEKGSPEYVKRKQLLDRMLYNSVRRIYNTLIHNSTEVKVFSKPTMITEIFQFLFKLPDHDTSVRPPPPKPVNKPPILACPVVKNVPGMTGAPTGLALPNQSGKLSDLKRVFQRVACFPCEYLIDVHKLLFMTDCDPKVIRQNIFGFKGFSFGVDSPEFQQRKMYLEYLTFHSLRKISSVLTTRSVDLRNSTKHELATHLTQVLAEYTNTYVETEPIGTSEPSSKVEESSTTTAVVPDDPNVENIVVTPIIDNMHKNPSAASSESSASSSASSEINASQQTRAMEVSKAKKNSSSKAVSGSQPSLKISIVDTRSVRTTTTSTASTKGKRKRKSSPVKNMPVNIAPNPQTNIKPSSHSSIALSSQTNMTPSPQTNMTPSPHTEANQFADIHLPEIEQYRQMYGQNLNIYTPRMSTVTAIPTFSGSGVVPQSFSHLIPQTVPFPVVHTYPQPVQVQSPYQAIQQPSPMLGIQPPLPPGMMTQVSNKPNEMVMPVECILGDASPEEPQAKKSKVVEQASSKKCLSQEETLPLHTKIRNVVSSNDDEDCDKPLASFIGHPTDGVLRKQICDIVEQTDLQDITINGVIQKIYNMYPKFDLSYRKEFIKSTLRSILYRLGEQNDSQKKTDSRDASSPDCSVTTTGAHDSPLPAPYETAS